MLNEIIAFAYAAVTTLLAFYIYKKHYIKIKSKPFGLRTLAFIPLTLAYLIFFEIAFNSYRFFEPGFLAEHLQYHIFNDIFIFIAMFFVMWLVFQRTPVGKKTIIFSWVLGIIFEAFFAGESGSGSGGIIAGAIWIWVLHVNWFFTSLLVREKR